MGCNSHCYIEYRDTDTTNQQWVAYNDEPIDVRHYDVYAAMAGVRNYGHIKPIAPPRGFPEDASSVACDSYYIRMTDGDDHDDFEWVSVERAARWVADGDSIMAPDGSNRVSHPDWHTPSWLTAEEFCRAVIDSTGEPEMSYADGYWRGIVDLVRTIAERPNCECRVVFWFDN